MVKQGSDHNIHKLLLTAIQKIKHQKQRPGVDRIILAVNHIKPIKASTLEHQLELAVREGVIFKCVNKEGLATYRDPAQMQEMKGRAINVDENSDLTTHILKTITKIGEPGGSTFRTIEKHIQSSYHINYVNNTDLSSQLRLNIKRLVNLGKVVQEGRQFLVPIANSGYDSAGTASTASETVNDWVYEVIIEKVDRTKVLSSLILIYVHLKDFKMLIYCGNLTNSHQMVFI